VPLSASTPRIAICASDWVGNQLARYIVASEYPLEFICTINGLPFSEEISQLAVERGIHNVRLRSKGSQQALAEAINYYHVDLLFLLWWPDIIRPRVIELLPLGAINTHPSLLPWNRGKHPYFWSIVDATPAGVSLHFITSGIDDGDILYQEALSTDITTTGQDLYNRSLVATVELFKKHYQDIMQLKFDVEPQPSGGSLHYAKELDVRSRIDLDKSYSALDLINIMRARTFGPDDPSAFFLYNGKKYYVRVNISDAAD
jgi:methionyl-tRNA formyltransferase